MPPLAFEATISVVKGRAIVRLPESASEALPSRGQVIVKGVMNGHDLRQVLEPDGRWGHWFGVSDEQQKKLGVRAGDTVSLEIAPSKDWPEPNVPADFARALAAAPMAVRELWAKITPMARWEWVRWVNATGNQDTRARRVEVSISKLQSGKRRPCCFNLAACTVPELTRNGRLVEPGDDI